MRRAAALLRLAARGFDEAYITNTASGGWPLFFDAVRGFGRCLTCHQMTGLGIPVAGLIAKVPENAAALRVLVTPHVSTATADGETIPALVVSQEAGDLTSAAGLPHHGFVGGADRAREVPAWGHRRK